jgi:hypothetical protein
MDDQNLVIWMELLDGVSGITDMLYPANKALLKLIQMVSCVWPSVPCRLLSVLGLWAVLRSRRLLRSIVHKLFAD